MTWKKAQWLYQRKNKFVVCNYEYQKDFVKIAGYYDTILFNDARYRIVEGVLEVEGIVAEFEWQYGLEPIEKGTIVEGKGEAIKIYDADIQRKYWLFGPVVSHTIAVKFRRFVDYKVKTSNFNLTEKDYG
jgi:hypothetical protein